MEPDVSQEPQRADDLLDMLPDSDSVFGYLAGKVRIVGDIVAPVTPLADWESK